MCSLWFKKKNAFTFDRWCFYAFIVTVSYVITREWLFRVYFLHVENLSLSTKSYLMHIALQSEVYLRQLSNCSQRFLFLKETKWLSVLKKPRHLTSIGTIRHIQPFSTQSARSVSYRFFFRLCASYRFSSQETVNSMRTLFFESGHATMSSRFSLWIMWTGNYRDVLRSAETFQSLPPFSSFILEFFCFLIGHTPSLRNWIMGSLAVTTCWFAVSHCISYIILFIKQFPFKGHLTLFLHSHLSFWSLSFTFNILKLLIFFWYCSCNNCLFWNYFC